VNELFRVLNAANAFPQTVLFFIVAATLLWRWSRGYLERKQVAKRQRIERLLNVLSDEKYRNNAYAIEQSFLDRYGRLINYRAIRFFLRQPNPSEKIGYYVQAKGFVDFNEHYTCLGLKPWLQRVHLPFFIWLLTFLFISFGFFGLLFLTGSGLMVFNESAPEEILGAVLTAAILFLYTWIMFEFSIGVEAASKLQ